ncbi:hypothetical protein TNCT_420081 [Trichonephila clavata]|uniref:Uncharacterized protein n=1 Tax=Trichonephila clavata TaxID=2740835 RepID=A0A8X6GYQ8_TRICU|nr:hypothetical protein TNCT_420081 [Trichonephila clavata]
MVRLKFSLESWKIITGNPRQLGSGLTATETKSGWAVIGRVNDQTSGLLVTSMLANSVSISELRALDSLCITDPSEKKTAKQLFLLRIAILHHLQSVLWMWNIQRIW